MINVRREKENDEPIAEFEEGIDWWIIDNAPEMSACLRFIDPYGNLLINQLQLPVLIAELEDMSRRTTNLGLKDHIAKLVGFLKQSEETHVYIRFIGD
jgi:hypothetical protein